MRHWMERGREFKLAQARAVHLLPVSAGGRRRRATYDEVREVFVGIRLAVIRADGRKSIGAGAGPKPCEGCAAGHAGAAGANLGAQLFGKKCRGWRRQWRGAPRRES